MTGGPDSRFRAGTVTELAARGLARIDARRRSHTATATPFAGAGSPR